MSIVQLFLFIAISSIAKLTFAQPLAASILQENCSIKGSCESGISCTGAGIIGLCPNSLLNKYAIQIFVYGVAAALAIGGAIYYFMINPGYEYNYAHYFQEHSNYDMIKDFFFIYSGRSEKLVNVLRWLGVFLLFTDKSDDKGIKFFKYLFLVLFIVFLSPLSVIGISKLIASNVYYRTFDVVFNPLTEMLFIVLVLKRFNKKWLYYGLSLFVVYMVVYAHLGSRINHYTGEYGFHINREVLPKYKISQYDYDVIKALQYEVEMHEDEDLRVYHMLMV